MNKPTIGTKVKDKFKSPRPGDESVFGNVVQLAQDSVTVEMETQSQFEDGLRTMPLKQFWALFEEVE